MVVRTHGHILCLHEPIRVKGKRHKEETNEEGKEKVLPHPKPMSHPVLADPGWTGGSHCKPQLIVEVAEVVQGVEDELPLRGISAVVVLIPQ